ncbi:MAG: glutamate--tRNA ligase, partial [Planctomycetales bacterium]|nr:glutamate--tRNA ligase [Planctomycetales bacterium]
EALQPILNGFRWLGIDWDEGPDVDGPYAPYYQSQRLEQYQAAVTTLVERGAAYHDYATPEEIQQERQAAEQSKTSYTYSRRWMAETPEERARFESEGRQAVVRLKMPREGTLELNDLIRGQVSFEWQREQDHVIQRADGSCLYHLATVVDDHDFQITHVIRAEEHLSNTPRQVFIAQSLGYELPQFAHIPFVAEPGSRTKLSKRKLDSYRKNRDFAALCELGETIAQSIGLQISAETFNPVIVDFYQQVGFLPHAVVNYLLLLGWSLDDRTEHFTAEEMINNFSLERVNKAPASFDPQKLLAFQAYEMQKLSLDEKLAAVTPFAERAGWIAAAANLAAPDRVRQVVAAAGDRLVVGGDILQYPEFFVADNQLTYDEKAFDKRLRKPADAARLLQEFRAVLADETEFTAARLEQRLKDWVAEQGIALGQVIHALRVAVTGKSVGFGMFESLEILGRESVLARIDAAMARV